MRSNKVCHCDNSSRGFPLATDASKSKQYNLGEAFGDNLGQSNEMIGRNENFKAFR